MKLRRFYCIRCMQWYGESSRSEHMSLCYHCWRFVCEYGWEMMFKAREMTPRKFTWEGVLGRIA